MGIIGSDWQDKLFVGGRWQAGSGDTIKVVAPASGEVLGALSAASEADVAAAASSAAEAQTDWARRSPAERAAVLRRAGQLWEEHADEIGEWIVKESGSIPPKAGLETHIAADECYEASALPPIPRVRCWPPASHTGASRADVPRES